MNDNIDLITVNEKREYHDCEMVFSLEYHNRNNGFKVQKDQKYKIHTSVKEVKILNEALQVYQAEGFKDTYLLYMAHVDGHALYPDFTPYMEKAHSLTKQLQDLSKDEDSLVQLSEYCLEIIPTYGDDFRINKHIESIIIGGRTRIVSGYEDLKDCLSQR